jgi:hypothetical protein
MPARHKIRTAHTITPARPVHMDGDWAVQVTNGQDQWVPSIPLPHTGLRKRCVPCGRRFWTRADYRGHYALVHILDLEEQT